MVSVNGIYKLAVIGTVNGQQHVHTLHFKSTGAAASVADSETEWQQSLIDLWQSSSRSAYRQLFAPASNPCVIYQVRKVCGTVPLPAGVDEAEAGANQAGTGAPTGDPQAPWLAQVTTIRTEFAGRSYRGRTFIGGLYEQDTVGATIQTGRMSNANLYYTALMTQFGDEDETTNKHRWFVFSRKLANGTPAIPPDPAIPPAPCQNSGGPVVGFTLRDQLASMKSRKAGSGL